MERQHSTNNGSVSAPVVSKDVIEVVKDTDADKPAVDAEPTDAALVMAMISSLTEDSSNPKKVTTSNSNITKYIFFVYMMFISVSL